MHSYTANDCMVRDRFVVDVVNLDDGSVTRLMARRVQIVLDLSRDGALYLQAGTELRRDEDLRVDSYDVMPSGLGLSANPWTYNPYC